MGLPLNMRDYDIFLSYAHSEQAFVERLYEWLRQSAGFEIKFSAQWTSIPTTSIARGLSANLYNLLPRCPQLLFRTVINRPAAERETYLTRVCNGDEELRLEVLSLLARDTSEDFIRDSIASAALSFTAKPKDDLTGERIGPYRVARLIGRGGMGAVYEAERDDEQFQQQVAIKIIKRGMDTDFVRDRFLRERQILASLDHPHIARLFDGGATQDGLPYFVMEFVAGEPITDYCRRHKLSLNEKLRLLRDVCSAVQHAHQKLAIHRDLKPRNILVTPDGTPKLLDFGIAKLLSPDLSEAYTRTETAYRLMTPEYASPEQALGQVVATTTDVYSLGVVLYELLTERRPHEFKTYSPAEIERAFCETEIEEPSKVAGRMTGAGARLARLLAGDLDNIVLMAMRKEPERRYQSVEQFSEDIRRYLAGMPVVARKDTFGYRAGKFIRRHKAGMAILALLAILVVAMTVQAARIARERDRANQEAATAQAVTQSLVAMFEVADPSNTRGNVITAKEILDQGAESLLREALALRRKLLGDESAEVADSLYSLGRLMRGTGKSHEAELLYRQTLTMRRKVYGADHPSVAHSLNNLAATLQEQGDFKGAEALFREALIMRRKLLGEKHPDVAVSLANLASVLQDLREYDEAEQRYRQVLALLRNLFGEEHQLLASTMNNLATLLRDKGDYEEAGALFRGALAMRRKLLGDEHPEVGMSLYSLAVLLYLEDEYDEAGKTERQAIDTYQKSLDPDHWRIHRSRSHLGACLVKLKRYREAEEQLLAGYAGLKAALGDRHAETQKAVSRLIELYESWGKPDQANPYRALPHTTPDKSKK